MPKYTFEKKIVISAIAEVSVDAESKEEALKKVNEEHFSLSELVDGSIGIDGPGDYKSNLKWQGDEYNEFTLEELEYIEDENGIE